MVTSDGGGAKRASVGRSASAVGAATRSVGE